MLTKSVFFSQPPRALKVIDSGGFSDVSLSVEPQVDRHESVDESGSRFLAFPGSCHDIFLIQVTCPVLPTDLTVVVRSATSPTLNV
jgi:hypothetical protein